MTRRIHLIQLSGWLLGEWVVVVVVVGIPLGYRQRQQLLPPTIGGNQQFILRVVVVTVVGIADNNSIDLENLERFWKKRADKRLKHLCYWVAIGFASNLHNSIGNPHHADNRS